MSISGLPEGFNPHKGIKRVFEGRRKMMETGEGIDWGFAEALAFGTLVSEGGFSPPPQTPRRTLHTASSCFESKQGKGRAMGAVPIQSAVSRKARVYTPSPTPLLKHRALVRVACHYQARFTYLGSMLNSSLKPCVWHLHTMQSAETNPARTPDPPAGSLWNWVFPPCLLFVRKRFRVCSPPSRTVAIAHRP